MRWRCSRVQNERGAALVYVAVAMTAVVALTAVGIDVSHLAFTAGEVQNAADIAATAGATAALGSGSPLSAAQAAAAAVLGQNKVNGVVATTAVPPGNIQVGTYASGTFSNGGAPVNAVKATGQLTMDNLLGSVFGDATSDVQKVAIATFGALGSAQPQLPLALGNCSFDCSGGLGCLPPPLTQAPAGSNNSGWTIFTTANPGKSSLDSLLPAGANCGGGGAAAPTVAVGSGASCPSGAICSVNANGGQVNGFLQDVACIFDNHLNGWTLGVTEFVIPIISNGCNGNVNGTYDVLGFATVVIDAVVTTGGAKGLTLHSVVNTSEPGPPGGANFGTGFVQLVG